MDIKNKTILETKQSLTNKAGIISLGKLAVSISGLASAMILSRFLSQPDYGTYRQVWLIYNTLVPLLIFGLPMSVNYFIPQKQKTEQKTLNIQTYLLLIVGGFFLSIFIFACSSLMGAWFNNPNLVNVLRVFSFIPLLTFPTLYYQNLLICLNKPRLVAGISSTMAILRLGAVVIPAFLSASLEKIFASLLLFSIFQLIIVTYYILKPFTGITLNWERTLLIQQLKYSVPLGFSTIVGTLTLKVDKINISSFFSTSQYAIYANGAIEVPLIGILTGSIAAVLMPEFVKLYKNGDKELLVRIWHNAIRKVALIILPIMFFLIVFASEFITLLFSSRYIDSVSIFQIYLLALPIRVTTFGMILLSMGLSSTVFRYALYTLFLNIFLNLIMIKTIGFLGPALATIFTTYVIGYFQLKKIAEEIKISIRKIFPWKYLFHIMIVAGFTGCILELIKLYLPLDGFIIRLIFGSILYGVIFLVCASFTHLITRKDLEIPLQFIKELCRN